MALARLDHIIYRTPDIATSHAWLTESLGYPEAWPIGRFWPQGLTSGVAIGGLNLELLQPDSGAPEVPVGTTLVFEPVTLDQARQAIAKAGIPAETRHKDESNPSLLRLRGFDAASSLTPHRICTNLIPLHDAELPFDFFVCLYSLEMRERLSPANPRLAITSAATRIVYGTPMPDQASRLLESLGYRGGVDIQFKENPDQRILEVLTDRGPLVVR